MRAMSIAQQRRGLAFGAARQRAMQPNVVTLPAPIGGLNSRDAWSDMDPQDAIRLDNFYPDFGKVTVRGGSAVHASLTLGGTPLADPVETLAELHTGSTRKLLAAAGGGLWDVTTGGEITSPVGGSTPFSNDRWQTVQMNGLLALVNGQNTPRQWNGSSLSTMAISGAGLSPGSIRGCHVFKSRSYFWTGNADFWVSELNTLGGALTLFPLADVTKGGGSLVTMESWTRDGGDGVDDLAVFVMSSGDVIVYQGSNPNDVDDWFLVGVFRIGSPVSDRAIIKLGSDLLVPTADGYSLLSRSLAQLRGARGTKISDKIVGDAIEQVKASGDTFGWQSFYYPRGRRLMVNYPTGGRYEQHVANLETGAWCRFRGMDARCWSLFDDAPYFGGGGGKVYLADTGATDDGAKIIAEAHQAFGYLGDKRRNKHVQTVGPLFEAIGGVRARISLAVDFSTVAAVQAAFNVGDPTTGGTKWDTAKWDTFKWGAVSKTVQGWISLPARGYAISPRVRVEQELSRVSWNGTRLSYAPEGVI